MAEGDIETTDESRGIRDKITRRLKALGIGTGMIILFIPGLALIAGLWFLGQVFYHHGVWPLGAICSVVSGLMGFAVVATLLIFVGMMIYAAIRGNLEE